MPLYEYKCKNCGSVFEILQNVDEQPLKKCLNCGSSVDKVISAPVLQFKGSGWYITDYAQKKEPEKKASKDEEKSPSKKADSGKNKKSHQPSSKD